MGIGGDNGRPTTCGRVIATHRPWQTHTVGDTQNRHMGPHWPDCLTHPSSSLPTIPTLPSKAMSRGFLANISNVSLKLPLSQEHIPSLRIWNLVNGDRWDRMAIEL